MMQKHIRNVSDEAVAEQFVYAYCQCFCGNQMFSSEAPCAASELVYFRHRIGEEKTGLVLRESVRANMGLEDRKKAKDELGGGKDNRVRRLAEGQTAYTQKKGRHLGIFGQFDFWTVIAILSRCRDARP